MTRTVIIGGSGHVGGYLVPRLVEAGHEVINVTRGQQKPYRPHAAWNSVRHVAIDWEAEDAKGDFGGKIAALDPDVVIDKICFTLDSAQQIVEALEGRVRHFLHTGTIWSHGHSLTVPTRESDPRAPFGDYGVWKSQIEDFLLDRAHRTGFPATVVRPGHIVGPGWSPLNPAGHFKDAAFQTIARGETLALPNFGLETVHHVHADDVAQVFQRSIECWSGSVGEAFNAVSDGAITLRGYAQAMYAWFGHDPKLEFAPYAEWEKDQNPSDARTTWEHIAHSPCHSIEKARRILGYAPRHSSIESVREAVSWLIAEGRIQTI